jgi:predicted RecA/RadA family phage recombinase
MAHKHRRVAVLRAFIMEIQMPQQNAIYSMESTREVAGFMDSVIETIENNGDGAAVLDGIKNEAGVSAPKHLGVLLSEIPDKAHQQIFDSVADGAQIYKREHGVWPTADVTEAALQQALVASRGLRSDLSILLDSASSSAHDQMSLQPNRAVVAILSMFSEAIPFAGYLPIDIGSNEARLAILSHTAGSTYGDYTKGGLLDGTAGGGVYTSSQRMVKFTPTGTGPFTSRFSQVNLSSTPGYCDPAGTGIPVLRGRTIVFINGLVAAADISTGSSATSPISGVITLPGTSTAITVTGAVTIASGDITVSLSSALPAGSEMVAQTVIDYETSPALMPSLGVNATVYPIYANPWRVSTGITIDAASQISNELGLDGASEALLGIRAQMAQERHYQALRMAYNLGKNNNAAFDFAFQTRSQQMVRAQIWQDFQAELGNADQKMANATMDHGITHIYCPAFVCAQFLGLGRDMFEPSGLYARPSIYRVGRLFGKYDIYYDPRIATQNDTTLQTAELVAVGRSTQVARNPVVLGDAVAATFLDLNMQKDLIKNAAVYGRDFTVTNPHQPSALGCARISITGMK